MSRRGPLLLCLLLLATPSPSALAGVASGPDAEGAWVLTFQITRDGAGPAVLALDVRREGDAEVVTSTRELGTADLPAGPSTREVAFLPAEGAGRYLVGLLVDGQRVDEVAFDVEQAGASRVIGFNVPDEPTHLQLTNDEVNTDGKTKSPGEALLTRAVVADANGLGELDGVIWRVERAGTLVETGIIPPPEPNATSHAFELRYDRAPLAAGGHALTIEARKAGTVVAAATRTFVIREVAPTFVAGALANVTPDVDQWQNVTITLADRNGPVGPGALDARVYRGSARAEGAGVAATLDAPVRAADAAGAGQSLVPLALRVPARASAGAYRVSLYHDAALLVSLPFEVRALPTLRGVQATPGGGRLLLDVDTSGEGFLQARLEDGQGASTRLAAPATNATRFDLAPPRRGEPLRWSVELLAREGGALIAERNGTWTPPLDGPSLALAPLTTRGRLPAAWRVDASGWSVEGANATFRFTRWDGAAEPTLRGEVAGARVRVHAPPDLAPGRYTGSLILEYANGSASEARWSFDAGAWLELELGEPAVQGRVANVPVENVGGVTVGRILVEVEPRARVSLLVDGRTLPPRGAGERAIFDGFTLAPGATATLRVEVPEGPARAGRHAVVLRVLARAEVG